MLMNINLLQLFILLMLIRTFIPYVVQVVIKGWDFASKRYQYIPFYKLILYSSIVHNFEFELTNKILDSQNISYDITNENTSSISIGF